MKYIPYRWPLGAALILVLGFLGWWLLHSDPRTVFLGKVDKMIEQANDGKHLALRKKLSPEAEAYITDNFMQVQQALMIANRLDTELKVQYRLAALVTFQPRDYAEIEMERSGPGGDFSQARKFPVPFIYREGDWFVAGGFRGELQFINPFE